MFLVRITTEQCVVSAKLPWITSDVENTNNTGDEKKIINCNLPIMHGLIDFLLSTDRIEFDEFANLKRFVQVITRVILS